MPANKPKSKGDYVGVYDGSKDRWMTRKMTDKGGNSKTTMVPESSNPNESRDYFEGFDRKKRDSKLKFLEPKKVK
jgi:hypothetical protein